MKRRILSMILAAVLLLGLFPTAMAAQTQEDGTYFVFAAASSTTLAAEPCRIYYTEGQTIREALAGSEHSFVGLDGLITAVDGVSGNFSIYDDAG